MKAFFIFPIIRTDFIDKAISTLSEYTLRKDYKIIVVDQSIDGIGDKLKKWLFDHEDFYIRIKNQGFSRACNTGITLALRQKEVPYIALCNDDIEIMYRGWFDDAIEEFNTDPHIIAVSPESPRVAMWGYGLAPDKYVEIVPHKDKYTDEDIKYLKEGNYDEKEIKARHDFEIPKSFPFTKRGICDGIAMWFPIFKREGLIELGLLDEEFIWGGGEDYSYLTRAYSCAWPIDRTECDPSQHRRMVATMKSWVFHKWGQSKDVKETLSPELFKHKKAWNDLDSIWPPHLNGGNHSDPWGHWTDDKGVKRPFRRIPEVYIQPV